MSLWTFSVESIRPILQTLRAACTLDKPLLALLLVFSCLYAPTIPRATDNALMLAAFVNDEPALTMALDAMTVPPYGNPANFYFKRWASAPDVPHYWHHLRYGGFTYYGGTYLDIGFLIFAPLKWLGLPTFPAAPIILRTISFLSALLALTLLYHFGRTYLGRPAAIVGVLLLFSDVTFLYYATIIHPDTLQMALGLLTLLLAIRHAGVGDWPTLVSLGIVAGLFHGTKSGGPWLAPTALLAVYWGWRKTELKWGWQPFGRLMARWAMLGAVTLAFFFVSTPYAFLDRYHFRTLRTLWKMLSRQTLEENVNFLSWMRGFHDQVGPVLFFGMAVAALAFVLRSLWTRDKATTLALVLALSNLAWYSFLGGMWVVPGYFILALGLLIVFLGKLCRSGAEWVQQRLVRLNGSASALFAVLLLTVISHRWFPFVHLALGLQLCQHSTQTEASRWACANVTPNDTILFDDLAYLDPERLPRQKMHGRVIRYVDVANEQPSYILLSSSLYDAAHFQRLRMTQDRSPSDTSSFSMRLYQDLIDRSDTTKPGPTAVPGITFVARIDPTRRPPESNSFLDRTRYLYRLARECLGLEDALGGPTLLIYRVDPNFTIP